MGLLLLVRIDDVDNSHASPIDKGPFAAHAWDLGDLRVDAAARLRDQRPVLFESMRETDAFARADDISALFPKRLDTRSPGILVGVQREATGRYGGSSVP